MVCLQKTKKTFRDGNREVEKKRFSEIINDWYISLAELENEILL